MSPSLRALHVALERLAEALDAPETGLHRDAAVQRFELCFELAWRSVKRRAREIGLECRSPKGCFRLAFQQGWIDDEEKWFAILDDRNLTSHTYDEAAAIAIYRRLPGHLDALRKLAGALESQ